MTNNHEENTRFSSLNLKNRQTPHTHQQRAAALLWLLRRGVCLCCRINSCVGQANHRSFLLTLCVFVSTSLYGISLVLGSLCPRQYLMTALLYCPAVYSQSRYSTLSAPQAPRDCTINTIKGNSRWEASIGNILKRKIRTWWSQQKLFDPKWNNRSVVMWITLQTLTVIIAGGGGAWDSRIWQMVL